MNADPGGSRRPGECCSFTGQAWLDLDADLTQQSHQHHLLHALREFERFYNGIPPAPGHRERTPLYPLPAQVTDPDPMARLNIRRRDRLGGILHEYEHAA
jgi:hypothetical protein